MHCFAKPVIRRRFAPTGWLAMTGWSAPPRPYSVIGSPERSQSLPLKIET
ncbi:hypothetical protein ACVILL_003338 [Bradyrhizobium sp. USDA 3364]